MPLQQQQRIVETVVVAKVEEAYDSSISPFKLIVHFNFLRNYLYYVVSKVQIHQITGKKL